MALVFLRSECAPINQASFQRSIYQWDTVTRQEVSYSAVNATCSVRELAVGAVVDQWCDLTGSLVTVYYKLGAGYEPGLNLTGRGVEPNYPTCPVPQVLTFDREYIERPSSSAATDGLLIVPYATPYPPVTGVLSNGLIATVPDGLGYLNFAGLAPGTYDLQAEDAAGNQTTLTGIQLELTSSAPRQWLRYQVKSVLDPDEVVLDHLVTGSYWDFQAKAVRVVINSPDIPDLPIPPETLLEFSLPLTTQVDAYPVPNTSLYRRVYHRDDDGDGQGDGDVRFVDTVDAGTPDTNTLRLENVIVQHVHQPAPGSGLTPPATGRVLLEARSPAPGALTFTRLGTGESNATGQFKDLPAGEHRFRVQDSGGQSLEETVRIEDRYRPRFFATTFTSKGVPVRLDILGRDFDGAAEEVRLSAEGIVRSWEGGGGDLEGTLPEAAGQACALKIKAAYLGQLRPLKVDADDRAHRVDLVVGGVLVFRGYVAPDFYDEDLRHTTGGVIELTAADGLGSLRDTSFLNHQALPLTGRRSLLSTLLHCLSRCEAGPLPLYVQTGLREVLMTDAAQELLDTVYSDRESYRESGADGREWSCRQVVEAILRLAHATLFQRGGAWWVLSANVAADALPFWSYAPNGELLSASVPAPAPALLKPATFITGTLHWGGDQREQTLATARAQVVTTKLDLVENQLADGLLQRWQPDGVRPLGWGGTLRVVRQPSDTAGQTLLHIPQQQLPAAKLVSPAFPHRDGANETPVLVRLRLRVPALPADADGKVPDLRMLVQVRGVVGGTPLPSVLHWEVGSSEKEVTVEGFLLLGGQGTSCVLELLTPMVINDPNAAPLAPDNGLLDVFEVTAQILPGAVKWPTEDSITALNEAGFFVLPQLALHHADTPALPVPGSTVPAPVPLMDAFAWRHTLSYADGTPTTLWRRPYSIAGLPLLESAGADRLDVRRGPVSVLAGTVRGSATAGLGFGAVVDVPQDAPGERFWVVSYEVNELRAEASVTLREIGRAAAEPLPANRLIAHTTAPLVTDEGYTLAWG